MTDANYCHWVSFDHKGRNKLCPFVEQRAKLKPEKIAESLCTCCLEGQKVDAFIQIGFALKKFTPKESIDN
ncbi:MAG: hypothetical protein OIN87_12820 [Candidatus Methanoperedens sp.]|nr:hypothetical protein [Candidatus Methanoperedens sp.]